MQAIEFVKMQQDDDLWDLLIALALSQPSLIGKATSKTHAELYPDFAGMRHSLKEINANMQVM